MTEPRECDCVPGHRCDCWQGPRIVCICGSTRFAAHMNTEAERLTLEGAIVVRPEVVAYSRERAQQFVEPEVKAALDVLHLRKIDLADEVVVVTVEGYIGESTRREIAYAEANQKPVTYRDFPSAVGVNLGDEGLAGVCRVCGMPAETHHRFAARLTEGDSR